MKRVLITGANSYIGRSFTQFLESFLLGNEYSVSEIDVVGDTWKKVDFSNYDVVFHVAGLVHQKETEDNRDLYFAVNHKLTIELAKKAKEEGVKQFIFLSSGTIYGKDTGEINKTTLLNAKTNYGKSKQMAENDLEKMRGEGFKVVILRPLMVYGKNCKGNFQTVIRIVKKSPVFPMIHNKRSLIYIDNLSSFVKMTIDKELDGIFFPKNQEDADISVMAEEIANALGKKIYISRLLGAFISLITPLFSVTRKAFGSMRYIDTEDFDYSYCVVGFRESVRRSV